MGGSDSKASPPPSPPPKLLYDTPWRKMLKSEVDLQDIIMRDIECLTPTIKPAILLIGPVKSGKSSYINSCMSVGENRHKAVAPTGSVKSSFSLHYKSYTDNKLLKYFRLMDSMGIEPNDGEGCNIEDIVFLLRGHLKKYYMFDPEKPISVQSRFYRKNPKFEHRTQCVVFVIDAKVMYEGIPEAFVDKIKFLQDKIRREYIPVVMILTKVDLLCEKVNDDASNIFRSVKIQKAMEKASEVFSIDFSSIHPVINYECDLELSIARNIPILLALRQILMYACNKVHYVRNESESVKEGD